ncbi:MAG: hypothetical protein AAF467_26415 [Actinomycetota bacterium]
MHPIVLTALLTVANVLGAGMIVPQVTRLRRYHHAAGVSAVGTGVGLALNGWWIAYGINAELWGVLPVSVTAAALYAVVAVQLTRRLGVMATLRPMGFGAGVLGMAPLPLLIIGGWSAAAVAIGISYSVQFAPALVASLRTTDPAGVSATTWAMAAIEAAIWFGYGTITSDPALLIGGAGGGLTAVAILARLAMARPDLRRIPVARSIPM